VVAGRLQYITVYYSILQYVISILQYTTTVYYSMFAVFLLQYTTVYYSMLQFTTVYYSTGALFSADTFHM